MNDRTPVMLCSIVGYGSVVSGGGGVGLYILFLALARTTQTTILLKSGGALTHFVITWDEVYIWDLCISAIF